jgi:TetR/AcrR family transcriptional repressor of lmrAB and yxaGH operons
MALPRVSEEELMRSAAEVFRTYGFEGASLRRLADATGLEKASLYHRFPGGKEEIAVAVAERVNQWFATNIFDPLQEKGTPVKRLQLVAAKLQEFYGDGRKSCTLETLSLPGGGEALAAVLRAGLQSWLDAFTRISREGGHSAASARTRAEQAIIEVEGSLVLSRVLGHNRLFLRMLGRLPELLLS